MHIGKRALRHWDGFIPKLPKGLRLAGDRKALGIIGTLLAHRFADRLAPDLTTLRLSFKANVQLASAPNAQCLVDGIPISIF